MLNSKILTLITLTSTLVGCSGSYTPEKLPEANAMKQGPGLLSGKNGTFTLYASEDCSCNPEEKADSIPPSNNLEASS